MCQIRGDCGARTGLMRWNGSRCNASPGIGMTTSTRLCVKQQRGHLRLTRLHLGVCNPQHTTHPDLGLPCTPCNVTNDQSDRMLSSLECMIREHALNRQCTDRIWHDNVYVPLREPAARSPKADTLVSWDVHHSTLVCCAVDVHDEPCCQFKSISPMGARLKDATNGRCTWHDNIYKPLHATATRSTAADTPASGGGHTRQKRIWALCNVVSGILNALVTWI